ncbi:MAG TPA: hypothetical protein VFN35_01000 [Ktedonobacteraceae bacterium]|nr:hypothetical protein [Ktedonobacteraceae bacterium]
MLSSAGLPHWCVIDALLRDGDSELAKAHLVHLGTRAGEGRRDRIAYLRAFAAFAQWEGHLKQAISSLESEWQVHPGKANHHIMRDPAIPLFLLNL